MFDKRFVAWLARLRQLGRLTMASCPDRFLNDLESLVRNGMLRVFNDKKRLYVEIAQSDVIGQWIDDSNRASPVDTPSRAAAIAEHMDSKAGNPLSFAHLMFRSSNPGARMSVDGQGCDLETLSRVGGALTLIMSDNAPKRISGACKLYLIENRENWAHAERYLPADGVYLHYEGWISDRLMGWLKASQFEQIVISPDYDLVGLANWIRLSDSVDGAAIHEPYNFDELFDIYPNETLWRKQIGYLESVSENVVRRNRLFEKNWLNLMREKGAVLEQEALLIKKAIM